MFFKRPNGPYLYDPHFRQNNLWQFANSKIAILTPQWLHQIVWIFLLPVVVAVCCFVVIELVLAKLNLGLRIISILYALKQVKNSEHVLITTVLNDVCEPLANDLCIHLLPALTMDNLKMSTERSCHGRILLEKREEIIGVDGRHMDLTLMHLFVSGHK